jgi:hypothetical protein
MIFVALLCNSLDICLNIAKIILNETTFYKSTLVTLNQKRQVRHQRIHKPFGEELTKTMNETNRAVVRNLLRAVFFGGGIKVIKLMEVHSFGEELTKTINETNRAVVRNLLPAALF